VSFEVHEHFQIVSFAESAGEAFAVFMRAANKIIGDPDIQRAARHIR
jgi:hypothetical protein